MRVAFDITPQLTGRTGVARYLAEITAALEHRGVGVDRFSFGRAAGVPPPGTRHVPLPARLVYPAWRWIGLPPLRALAPRAQIVHCGASALARTRLPLVATVHDLEALKHPGIEPRRARREIAAQLATLPRAAAVIAVSAAVAADLRSAGVDPARVHVVHHGVSPLPPPTAHGIKGSFALAVGSHLHRKGFELLIRAFARARAGGMESLRLVIAGPPGPQSGELMRLCLRLGVCREVMFAGTVPDAELAGLYRDAAAVCVPSVGEGFGFPVIEAMAAGAPVIASRIPVLEEVGGGLVRFATPGDEREWAAALAASAAEAGRRDPAGEDARKTWAARFTWEQAAAETAAVYEAILADASGGLSDSRRSHRRRSRNRPRGGEYQ